MLGLVELQSRARSKNMIVDRLSKLLWMPIERVEVNVSSAGLGIDRGPTLDVSDH